MFNFINQQAKMFCINRSAIYAKKGDFNSICKSLKWMKRSINFTNKEERDFLKDGLEQIIKKNAE